MTEKELKKELMEYEAFIRFDEEDKEEPETDDEGAFITNSWEWTDDGRWLWEQDEDGSWHRTGFRKGLFGRYVKSCVKYYEEELRKEHNLPKPSDQ